MCRVLGTACLLWLTASLADGGSLHAGGTGSAAGEVLRAYARSFAAATAAPDAAYRITTAYAPIHEVYLGYAQNRRIVVGLAVDASGYEEALDALSLHGHVPALAVNTGENLQANRVVRENGRILLRHRSNEAFVADQPLSCAATAGR
ncbi:MAG: hypothetical protein KIS92_20535 [Planctomycetota bacterium]|nr:hypothetical protein [Planctomycetota bacterium]